jgi:hypothetical protein
MLRSRQVIKQVRTKNNSFNTVKYDKDGNILTPSRIRALKKAKKENSAKPVKGPKWVKITSQFHGTCSVCNGKILIGTPILWNKKNKQTKHGKCPL